MSFRGFNAAWLKEYQARNVGPVELPDVIGFTLERPTRLLNELLRMHHIERTSYRESLSAQIAAATGHLPMNIEPMQRARVTITRYSVKLPDWDGLYGSAKPLVDCLLVRSAKHPSGLGFLVDDSPAHLDLIVRSERVPQRSKQRTVVLIERLPDVPS